MLLSAAWLLVLTLTINTYEAVHVLIESAEGKQQVRIANVRWWWKNDTPEKVEWGEIVVTADEAGRYDLSIRRPDDRSAVLYHLHSIQEDTKTLHFAGGDDSHWYVTTSELEELFQEPAAQFQEPAARFSFRLRFNNGGQSIVGASYRVFTPAIGVSMCGPLFIHYQEVAGESKALPFLSLWKAADSVSDDEGRLVFTPGDQFQIDGKMRTYKGIELEVDPVMSSKNILGNVEGLVYRVVFGKEPSAFGLRRTLKVKESLSIQMMMKAIQERKIQRCSSEEKCNIITGKNFGRFATQCYSAPINEDVMYIGPVASDQGTREIKVNVKDSLFLKLNEDWCECAYGGWKECTLKDKKQQCVNFECEQTPHCTSFASKRLIANTPLSLQSNRFSMLLREQKVATGPHDASEGKPMPIVVGAWWNRHINHVPVRNGHVAARVMNDDDMYDSYWQELYDYALLRLKEKFVY